MTTIICVDCGKPVICITRIARRCPTCAKVHDVAKNKAIQGRYHKSTRSQYTYERMSTCSQCGLKFGAFSKQEKYCMFCKKARQQDSKRRQSLGLTYHDFAEKPAYHAIQEITRDANYRIDNDPNGLFSGAFFRKIDIRGGVADGWLIGATVTNIKTGKQVLAEDLK